MRLRHFNLQQHVDFLRLHLDPCHIQIQYPRNQNFREWSTIQECVLYKLYDNYHIKGNHSHNTMREQTYWQRLSVKWSFRWWTRTESLDMINFLRLCGLDHSQNLESGHSIFHSLQRDGYLATINTTSIIKSGCRRRNEKNSQPAPCRVGNPWQGKTPGAA